ncbi:aldose epimerase [Actinomyces bowdenii]|nr:aldose epimerase [Actinomyces bowdenii]
MSHMRTRPSSQPVASGGGTAITADTAGAVEAADEPQAGINGRLIDLEAGPYRARIATCGATLVHLRRSGRDLVLPFDAQAALPGGWQGKALVPWPNRVAGARYTYGGTRYLLACNEPETGAALHGLVGWSDFQVARRTGDELILVLTLPASYGYPWALGIRVRFTLDAREGLRLSITTTSLGAARPAPPTPGAPQGRDGALPAPYGVSYHPYLTRSVPIDQCHLSAPGRRVLETDPVTLAPAGERGVEGTDWDWREGRLVGPTSTDNAYLGLPEGTWQVRLRGGDGEGAVVLEAQSPWLQLYTAEHLGRAGVAVEPMTCPPDAFNSGRDLILLEAGQSHEFRLRLYEED